MTEKRQDAREADLNADTSVEDVEIDSGTPMLEESATRYRDPVTKRFAKRPTEEGEDQSDDEPGQPETARDRIAKQFQEMRKAEGEEGEDTPQRPLPKQLKTGMTEEEVEEQIEIAEAEREEAKTQKAQAQEPAEAKGPVPLTVVVDGQFFQVDRNDPRWSAEGATDDQVRAIAQLRLASEKRFAESKANQVTNQDGQGQPPANQPGRAPSPPPNEAPDAQTTGLNQEKIGEIVDRLQYGNRDEAAEALIELTKLTSSPQQQQPDIQAEVHRALVEQRNQEEIERAVSSFEKNNGDLTGNKHLQTVVLDVAVETMVEDMRQIGVPEEILTPIMGKGRIIAAAYRNMRNEGFPLKTHEEVLERAGEKVRAAFNMPRARRVSDADKPTIEKRVEQKRNMQQQPRSAGVRQAPEQAPRPLTRAEIIQQAKRQRMPWMT